jgi:hypothetical protein
MLLRFGIAPLWQETPSSRDAKLLRYGLCAIAAFIVLRLVEITFGRVPFAFYVAHVLVTHLVAMALGIAQGFRAAQFATIFFLYPKGYGVGLDSIYLFWLFVVLLLYPWCRWMAAVKERRRDWWLSYV